MSEGRWDGDDRGEGVADAVAFAPAVESLLGTMRRRNWVAEEPEVHLLPHIRPACAAQPLELVAARTSEDGALDVELRWTGEPGRVADAKAAVLAVVGAFSEASTFVRQHGREAEDGGESDGLLRFEVVTGFLDGDVAFAAHGHTARFLLTGVS